jgi:hypothetical protein
MTDEQIRDAIAEFDHDKDGQVRMLNRLKLRVVFILKTRCVCYMLLQIVILPGSMHLLYTIQCAVDVQ